MVEDVQPGEEKGAYTSQPSYQATPGMQMIQDSLKFTDDRVLKADIVPAAATGKILADQAAGMLMQDVESFSQGMMQIATAAISKVTAEIIATDGAQGETALTQITQTLGELPTFITDMATAAQSIEGSFSSSKPTGGTNEFKAERASPRDRKEDTKDKPRGFFFRRRDT